MNRGQVRSLVRIWLNEPTEGFWTDSELNVLINIADKVLNTLIRSLKSDYFTTPKTFTTTANSKSYAWPTDFAGLLRLEHYSTSNPSKDIEEITILEWPHTQVSGEWLYNDTGKPKKYIPFGDHYDLWPIPDAAYPIRIYFDQIKADFTQDTDIPSSPAEYHDMIAIWTVILALPKNHEDPGEFINLWRKREADLTTDLRGRKVAGPLVMEESWEAIQGGATE